MTWTVGAEEEQTEKDEEVRGGLEINSDSKIQSKLFTDRGANLSWRYPPPFSQTTYLST